jgi:hypothetical protein
VLLHSYQLSKQDDILNTRINSITHNTFLLLHYFVATCFGPSGPSSGHTGAMSEAKLYVKLQLKIHKIELHKAH